MKNFKMEQLFTMINAMDDKTHVFAKGVDASGEETYAFVLDNGIYNRTTKEEMTQIFIDLQKEGWKYGTTMDVVDIPILGKEPKSEEDLKAPKEPKRRPKKTVTPAEPKKEKMPPMWLFPKKEGRRKVYSADNFDAEAYKAKAKELGLLTAKGKVLPENREKVYLALGAKKNPDRVAYDKAREGK